jgi:hypothetical protein
VKRFIQGEHRGQSTLLPESLDDYVSDTNPVRVVDVFVDELDLVNLGFEGAIPADTGRPAYHPSVLLKIYIYGYLNRIQSSRRLEREAQRNFGSDRDQLSSMAKQARDAIASETLAVVADRGYFKSEEILACHDADITAYVPKPMTSSAKADGRFNKDAFVYDATKNEYICPAGEALPWRFSSIERGMNMHCYWSSKCQGCALKTQCTPGKNRRARRWELETVLEEMQRRLNDAPDMMRIRKRKLSIPSGRSNNGWARRIS